MRHTARHTRHPRHPRHTGRITPIAGLVALVGVGLAATLATSPAHATPGSAAAPTAGTPARPAQPLAGPTDWPVFHGDAARDGVRAHTTLLTRANATALVPVVTGGFTTTGAAMGSPLLHSLAPAVPLTTTEDWPTYLHDPQRTSASGETLLSVLNASQLSRSWSYTTGAPIAAEPAVVGGIVYVGSWDGYEYALDAASGALKWKTFLGLNYGQCLKHTSRGITSSATVSQGVVYVGGADSYWYALSATTGAVLWKVYTGDSSPKGGYYNWSSPLLYKGHAYIGTAGDDCPLVQGKLLDVSLRLHRIVRVFEVVPNGQVGGGIWTSPSLDAATNTLYVSTGNEGVQPASLQPYARAIVALDAATLAVKGAWQVPGTQAGLDFDLSTTPTLFRDVSGRALVATMDKNGILYAFDRTNVSAGPVWQDTITTGGAFTPNTMSSGAFDGTTLYIAGGTAVISGTTYAGAVRALDPASGAFLWEHGAHGLVIGSIAWVNGLIVDGPGAKLEVLDAANGTVLYTFTTGGQLLGAPSVSGGRIVFGSKDGTVYALGVPAHLVAPRASRHSKQRGG